MTDHYHSIAVALEKNIRDDDAKPIIDALKMIKGVLSVKPYISDFESHMAEERAKKEYAAKLWKVLYPKTVL